MQQGGATGVRCPHARQRLRQSARSTSQPRSAKWHARGLLPRAHVSLLTSAIAPGSPPSQPPCSAPPSAPPTSSRDRIIHRFRWPVTRNLPRKWSIERVRSCGFGLGFEGDVIAEAFEAALEIGNSAMLADLVEIGLAEIAI